MSTATLTKLNMAHKLKEAQTSLPGTGHGSEPYPEVQQDLGVQPSLQHAIPLPKAGCVCMRRDMCTCHVAAWKDQEELSTIQKCQAASATAVCSSRCRLLYECCWQCSRNIGGNIADDWAGPAACPLPSLMYTTATTSRKAGMGVDDCTQTAQ